MRSHLEPDGVFVQWIGLNFVDETLLRSLAATLVDVFGHVEVYQLSAAPGILFAASGEPLAPLENARRALQAHPEDFARFGFHRLEDFAAVRLIDEAGTQALAEGGALNTDDHNLLATRSSRLGEATLASRDARELWKDLDPLLAGTDGLDRSALIRRLVATRFADRASALALSESGALREAGRGWIELGSGRRGRAVRYFKRAVELAPGSSDAAAGLLASRVHDVTQGIPVEGISERDLDGRLVAVIAGWRGAAAGDWDAVAAVDAELSRIQPGDALFEEASRLRAGWRIARDEPEAAAEAHAILETLLLRQWTPNDSLLSARAAIAADRPAAAWGSLSLIARAVPTRRGAAAVAGPALELAEALPEDLAENLRARFLSADPRAARQEMGTPASED